MSQLKSCVADVMDRIRRRHDADPGEFWHACLFWTFWVSLALFPIGYGWREVTPPLCFTSFCCSITGTPGTVPSCAVSRSGRSSFAPVP